MRPHQLDPPEEGGHAGAPAARTGSPQKPEYHPSLDGLRAVAVLMVVFGHAGYFGWVPLVPGLASTGVILFFFLSGFLMAHHYLPDAERGATVREGVRYWAAFLLRRGLRVYPPYFLAPVIGYLLLMPHMPPDFETTQALEGLNVADELIKIATFSGNPGIYWTIELELFFYACYPFLIVVFLFCGRSPIVPLALFAGLSFLNHFPHGIGDVSWTVPLPGLWTGYSAIFVGGVCTGILAKRLPDVLIGEPGRREALVWASVLGLAAAFAIIAGSEPTHASMWHLEWLFVPLCFVMFTSLVGSQGPIAKVLSSCAMVTLGKASYTIYLVHIIAFYVVIHRVGAVIGDVATYVVVLAGLAAVYYLFIERPFVRLSKQVTVGPARRVVAEPAE